MGPKTPSGDARKTEDRELGISPGITRRDFLNATLLASGAALLNAPSPAAAQWTTPIEEDAWYGPGGVGEYAASHGNTPEVVRVAHDVRDGRYERVPGSFVDTRETYDLIVVGGGFSGLSAAYAFLKERKDNEHCLLLENHPIFGGEAKRNEFLVNGERVIGPQGSNGFVLPQASFGDGATLDPHRRASIEALARVFAELRVPTDLPYREWDSKRFKPLKFALDNYGFMLWTDDEVNVGYRFDSPAGWRRDIWASSLKDAPFLGKVADDLRRWRTSEAKPHPGNDFGPWLDGMTYKAFLEGQLGLSPRVTEYADPILAGALGLGCDALSAYATLSILMPGVKAYAGATARYPTLHSFPGGNDGFTRYYVKALCPEALPGGYSLGEVVDRPANLGALDRSGAPVRIRLGSSVVRVEHDGSPSSAEGVKVFYVKEGQVYRVRARGVVMATGSWINRHVVRDLPESQVQAAGEFHHSPMLVVNVALTNWRFLYNLGVTACRWFSGFGFSCNIRRPMMVGDYQPPLDPDKPTALTFYVPFFYPGQPIHDQGVAGRTEMLSTSFAAYERQIRRQMVTLFGSAGFDPRRDIAGIILNRWGHAYVNPQPGFYFGTDGKPAPRDLLRQRHGRIAFGHAEMEGHQNWPGAVRNGARAAQEIRAIL